MNFIQQCLSGDTTEDKIDDFIDEWHDNNDDKELHEFLGMSLNEYSIWITIPSILTFILLNHKYRG